MVFFVECNIGIYIVDDKLVYVVYDLIFIMIRDCIIFDFFFRMLLSLMKISGIVRFGFVYLFDVIIGYKFIFIFIYII